VDHLIIVTIICVLCVQGEMAPLHYACDRGHTRCAKLLLQAGADANKTNRVSHSFTHMRFFTFSVAGWHCVAHSIHVSAWLGL
jgi:ankyrin repeat protein